MSIILSPYPVSKASIALLGPAPVTCSLTLSELRLQSLPRMLATIRAVPADALRIVLQEDSERAVLPLMLTLASLARVARIEVHDLAHGTVTPRGRLCAALGVMSIAAATVTGRWVTWRLRALTRRLLGAQVHTFGPVGSDNALYLKTNLMLGAKAGGSIGHVAGVANELVRRSAGCLVIAPERPPLLRPQARFAPVPLLGTYGVPPEVNHFRFNSLCVRAAVAALNEEGFGYIYQRMTLGNLAGVLLSRRFNLPLVLEYNGSEVWVSQNWGHKLKFTQLAVAVEEVCLRHAHRVVTVSEVLADELRARGVPAERIVWYPNCIDPEMFDPARQQAARQRLRQKLGIADNEIAVLFIGTFGLWHGAETLAEAARQALAGAHVGEAAGLPRLRFLFVGDGLRLTAVREILKSETERGEVIFTGLVPQDEAPGYLAMADIFSSPHVPSRDGSKFFGSPTKLFEYMAMARPIVASDLDQIGQVLQPAVAERELNEAWEPRGGETAVLVEPGSAEAIVRALRKLQRRPELRDSLAAAARRKALDQYTWRQHVDVIMSSLR